MKRVVSVVLTIAALLSVVFVFSSCSKEKQPTFEENIVGTWESQKDGTENKARLVFEYTGNELKGTQSYYDYDNSEWGELSFKVGERTEYTMTLLYDGGKMVTVSYAMGNDSLVFDNIIYTNESKNIKVDVTAKTYILDGIPMPVRAGIFFGMTKSEVKLLADTAFTETTARGFTYELPDYFFPKTEGYTWYAFENDRLIETGFRFDAWRNTEKEQEKLKSNLLYAYSEQYGTYTTFNWTTSDTISYVWKTGNMTVIMRIWDKDSIDIIYTLEDEDY
jgi:hypothetical protein